MQKHFVADCEERPGAAWLDRFNAGRQATESWYRGEGLADPPSAVECRVALKRHMPELVPHYDHVCALVGEDDMAHRILSHYRPPPIPHGCSQAVWLGEGGPALVRNYDYPLEIVSDRFEMTCWFGRRVIAKAQRPWGGCLDGMNESGLVASLTFGGSRRQGRGFSIILMLRYVLETCRNVTEAIATLSRLPVALSQNVTLLDRTGAYATLFLGPGRTPAVTLLRACTNHQETPSGPDSALRQEVLLDLLSVPTMTLQTLIARFLDAPLYSRRANFTTAYTAVYRPAEGRVEYLWPGKVWHHSFDHFNTGGYTHDYGDLMP
ncbi:C45 family autoproteolytic acyltransferase/hydrolase [Chelatococcus sp. GCM10030263]|uniref:C45 family autoproteolytic acyltransferase/hydolase n=1 Tax=Chelatococcus sp. GCM10030263 TaxID=3273387 RepID=UPI003607ECCD